MAPSRVWRLVQSLRAPDDLLFPSSNAWQRPARHPELRAADPLGSRFLRNPNDSQRSPDKPRKDAVGAVKTAGFSHGTGVILC